MVDLLDRTRRREGAELLHLEDAIAATEQKPLNGDVALMEPELSAMLADCVRTRILLCHEFLMLTFSRLRQADKEVEQQEWSRLFQSEA